jgi:hypothetical protein
MGAWTGLIWLRIGTVGGLLWMRKLTLGLRKTQGICRIAAELLASQKGLCSMELAYFIFMRLMCNHFVMSCSSTHTHASISIQSFPKPTLLRLVAYRLVSISKFMCVKTRVNHDQTHWLAVWSTSLPGINNTRVRSLFSSVTCWPSHYCQRKYSCYPVRTMSVHRPLKKFRDQEWLLGPLIILWALNGARMWR